MADVPLFRIVKHTFHVASDAIENQIGALRIANEPVEPFVAGVDEKAVLLKVEIEPTRGVAVADAIDNRRARQLQNAITKACPRNFLGQVGEVA
jgi:hypothetical protein